MSILYEVKCYADYKEDSCKAVFTSIADARNYMRNAWQDAINTGYYDFDEMDSYIRQRENIVTERTYYEDDNARVTWKMGKLEQILVFNIEEAENCLVSQRVEGEDSVKLAKVLCSMASDIDTSLKFEAEDIKLVAKQLQLLEDVGADLLMQVLKPLSWVMTKGPRF